MNERYFLRDKKVLDTITSLMHVPPGYVQQVNQILAHPGSSAQELIWSVHDLEQVWRDVASLPGVG